MKSRKIALCLFIACTIVISCNSNSAIQASPQSENKTATTVFTLIPPPEPTITPTYTPTILPTITPFSSDEPGLIVTLGEEKPGPWWPGVPVFSPDGKIIALASESIRFWNVQTHELILELTYSHSEGCRLANAKFSSDGKLFAASSTQCWDGEPGYVMIWELASGKLLYKWEQAYAKMPPTSPNDTEGYSIPVSSLAFIPNSSVLVFGSGNSIEIVDALNVEVMDTLHLGPKMFASQLSISADGRLAYMIMGWDKTNDFPVNWKTKHVLQIWNINTHAMLREVKYPEGENFNFILLDKSLVKVDFDNETNQLIDLVTDEIFNLPYRTGWRYFNSDGRYILFARIFTLESEGDSFELWDIQSGNNIYTFMPDFGPDWIYGMHDIVFNPDNSILAIAHQERVSLWYISPATKPNQP